jgi:hypothetical protein
MAIIDSNMTGGGTWSAGASWTGGAVPGTGDTANIKPGDTITISSDLLIKTIFPVGGTLVIDAGVTITFDDVSGCGLLVSAVNSGGIICNGTASSPVTFKAATVVPTYAYPFRITPVSGIDLRTFTFNYVRLMNVHNYLGDITINAYFSTPLVSSQHITNVTPLSRAPNLIEHQIDGRAYSKIYHRGSQAGTVTITGYCRWDSYLHQTLLAMQAAGNRLCFFTENVQIPRCRFAQKPSYQPKPGSLYYPFSITLIEDL